MESNPFSKANVIEVLEGSIKYSFILNFKMALRY